MKYMNDYDIARAASHHADHPILGPAVETLQNLVDWTNSHSDGWAYWPKPCRAACKLITLIDGDGTWFYLYGDRDDVTAEAYRAALRPLKSFRTRHGADFDIVELS